MAKILHVEILGKIGIIIGDVFKKLDNLVSTVYIPNIVFNAAGVDIPLLDPLDPSNYGPAVINWYQQTLQNIYALESSRFNLKEHQVFRDLLSVDPFLGSIPSHTGTGGIIVSQSRLAAVGITNALNYRSYFTTGVSLVIYLLSITFSCNETCRNNLLRLSSTAYVVPALMVEMCKCNRHSNSFTHFFKVGLVGFSCTLVTLMGMQNSYLDVAFLETEIGTLMMLGFFARMNNASGCYIPFVSISEVLPLAGGQQLTICSIVTAGQDLFLHKNHSYGTSPDGVHIIDSVLSGRVLLLPSGSPVSGESLVEPRYAQMTSQSAGSFIVDRASGIIKNGKFRKEEKFPKDSSPSGPIKAAFRAGSSSKTEDFVKPIISTKPNVTDVSHFSKIDIVKIINNLKNFSKEYKKFKRILCYGGRSYDPQILHSLCMP